MPHTPGPWIYNGGSQEVRAGGDMLADLLMSRENTDANGRLMAAAPQMLAALKVALEVIVQDDCPMIHTQVRRAIEMAEGKS